MKILVVGGGSGGHITPAVAVVREVLKLKPRAKIEFWTDKKYYKNVVKLTTELGMNWGVKMEKGMKGAGFLRVRKVMAGKFRRYAGWKFWDYIDNIEITVKDLIIGNFCGLIGFLGGLVQSVWRLIPRRERPDVIFLKGGFVGLPVGLVASVLKIPIVVHESDVVMGLANKILAKRASVVATGMELTEDVSSVNGDGVTRVGNREWVGIPVAEEFMPVTKKRQRELKKAFGYDEDRPLVVMTGGSQGSRHMNLTMKKIMEEILLVANVGLVAGRQNYEEMVGMKKMEVWQKAKLKSNFRMWEFHNAMHELLGAADVVISRAGATTIAELAILAGPAVILVPFEKLPGGHQVKNAKKLAKMGAVEMIIDEEMMKKPEKLLEIVLNLVKDKERREALVENLKQRAKPGAAERLAEILLEVAGK